MPAWWSPSGAKARLAARAVVKSPRMQGGAGLTLEALVRFEWEVALGEEKLTRAELEALARSNHTQSGCHGASFPGLGELDQVETGLWYGKVALAAPFVLPAGPPRERVRLGTSRPGDSEAQDPVWP